MSEYGAYLLEGGSVFYENGMDILSLKTKISERIVLGRGARDVFDLGISSSEPILAFVKFRTNTIDHNKEGPPYSILVGEQNETWKVRMICMYSGESSYDVDVYVFSKNLPQPIPKYGMALFNESGTCILSNETKRLNLKNSGEISSRMTNIVLGGSFAVFPQECGMGIMKEEDPWGGGDVRYYESAFSYAAICDGRQTRIYGGAMTNDFGGNASNLTLRDYKVPSLYIDTSIYD